MLHNLFFVIEVLHMLVLCYRVVGLLSGITQPVVQSGAISSLLGTHVIYAPQAVHIAWRMHGNKSFE
jgi:hypothetical protein